jgi:peptide/nickel transport system substrate-binding protein
MSELTRRSFLRAAVVAAAGVAAASCAQPTAQVVEKEVAVEKVVKETVVVEKEVAIEKVVTATPKVSKYNESPKLAGLVALGELPPVEERLPEDPLVVTPVEQVGEYGGTWHRLSTSTGDTQFQRRITYCAFNRFNGDATGVVPDVAASWEANADSSVYTIKLRKGMKWSDGEPYTTDDIAFLFEDHYGNAEISPGGVAFWLRPHGEPATFSKLDAYTFSLDFGGPFAMFPLFEADNPDRPDTGCAHYMKQFHVDYADKAALDKATADAGYESWFQLYNYMNSFQNNADRPNLRAWYMVQVSPKTPFIAERNPYYWKVDTAGNQLPYIDRIEFQLVPNGDTVNLRAASGEVDMQARHITFDNYPIFKESEEQGDYRVLEWLWGENETVIHFTQDNIDPVKKELLEDKRFRFALSLAADRAEICQAVYYGTVEPSQIVPYPTSPWWTEERANFMAEYDPDRANAYLDEMGLTERDADGYRLMKNGERLVISYDYTNLFGAWAPIGELLRAHYEKIGLDLQIREVARQLFYERFRNRETELALWTGHATLYPGIRPRDFAAVHYGGSKWAAQYGRWWETGGSLGIEPPADSDIRKSQLLYEKVIAAGTQKEAVELFNDCLDLFYDNLWTMGFTTPPIQPVIVKNDFRNVPEDALATHVLSQPGGTAPEQYFIKQS